MSHRKPSKTDFQDDWRVDALCPVAVQSEPTLMTAWDNIFVGWDEPYGVDPQENVAREICSGCPVRRKCVVDAIADNESEGLRAGYRFSTGTVSKEDARAIRKEFSLTAKVRKAPSVQIDYETEDV